MFRTPSYRVFTTTTRESILDRLPVFVEMAGAHYRSVITPLPAPALALDTYVMANRPQWERVVTQLLGSQSSLIAGMDRGGFTLAGRSILYEVGDDDTFTLLAHEGWHQFTQATMRDQLPIWLDEGLATYMEGHRWNGGVPVFTPRDNPDRLDSLATACRSARIVPLAELVRSTPQDWIAKGDDWPLAYYAQVWALARFAADDVTRREALANILSLASRGELRRELSRRIGDRAAGIAMSSRTGSAVLDAFFDRDTARLEREYRAFVEGLVRGTPDFSSKSR